MSVARVSLALPARARPEPLRSRRHANAMWRFARRKPLGTVGAAIVVAMAAVALLADVVAPYDPLQTNYARMFTPPGAEHWLGTDAFGRDVLSRLLHGSRTALLVGFAAAFTGATLGLAIGTASGYLGGRLDLTVQRVMDVFLSFPLIILALAVVSILGTGTSRVILAIIVPMIPRAARVCRANALAIREMAYVEAARAAGLGHGRIILRHVVPNVMAPYLIMLTAFLGQAIFARGVALLPGTRGPGADARLGPYASWRRLAVRRDRPVDGHLPRVRHQSGGVCLQSVRRLAPRRDGPATPDTLTPSG